MKATSISKTSSSATTTIQAIIFRRTIRASYASLDLVYYNINNDNEEGGHKEGHKEEHIVAILQCPFTRNSTSNDDDGGSGGDGVVSESVSTSNTSASASVSSWRSNIRRMCKLGTEIELVGSWCTDNNNIKNNECQAKRFRVEYSYNQETKDHQGQGQGQGQSQSQSQGRGQGQAQAQRETSSCSTPFVKVIQMQKWDMIKCQLTREKYYPGFDHDNKNKNKANKNKNKNSSCSASRSRENMSSDGGTRTTSKKDDNNNVVDSDAATPSPSLSQRKQKRFEGQTGHGGGLGKRKQGEIVTEFLIDLLTVFFESNENDDESSKFPPSCSTISMEEEEYKSNNDGSDGNDGNGGSNKDALIEDLDVEQRFVDFDELKKMNKNLYEYSENGDGEYCAKRKKIIEYLNRGSGVMDVAGGSGHLSLALALNGIKSTVIDPRETVGMLPGRDRKVLRRALKKYQRPQEKENGKISDGANNGSLEQIIMPPPIEFTSMRAWFSKRPDGVDVEFREGKSTSSSPPQIVNPSSGDVNRDGFIPICTECSSDGLLSSCSAIVALHPDEATGEIVDFAVKHQTPFVVVPCCVFSRLFPTRYKPLKRRSSTEMDMNMPQTREIVSTYDDLVEYLVNKDESIRITKLNFEGANLALWSMFDKKY